MKVLRLIRLGRIDEIFEVDDEPWRWRFFLSKPWHFETFNIYTNLNVVKVVYIIIITFLEI